MRRGGTAAIIASCLSCCESHRWITVDCDKQSGDRGRIWDP